MGGGMLLQFDFFEWLAGIPDWLWWLVGVIWEFLHNVVLWAENLISFIWLLVIDNFWWIFKAVLFPGLIFIVMTLIFFVWATRKLWGRIQMRRGPFHMGKYGGVQLFADAIKLIAKETIIPDNSRRWMYRFLPGFLLVMVLLPFGFIPWDETWVIADLSVSLVLIFAFLTAVPVIALLAGWISGSKYSLIGGFRAANNQFACEIPMIISSVGPAMLAGSLSVMAITQAQSAIWYVVLLPINTATFLTAAIASVGTFPFDAPVADSEIIFGWRTEFSGIYFTLTYFAEFAEQILYSALIVTFFLGGFHGVPYLPGVVNFIIKFLIVLFLFIFVSSSFHRLRQDQIVYYCWRYLMPLAILNIVVAMLAIVYVPGLALLLVGG